MLNDQVKPKIAAYCRVSTDKDEQIMSLQAQKEFFMEYANRNHLELVEVYADEGISGTKLKNRREFKRMMKDAERGRFSSVHVKDVSRLARNVVDFLQSIRKLKSLNVDCRFVTANMSSNDGELTLTILAAVAQEESANISKRVKFGKKRNAEKGRVPNLVYGYDKIHGEYFDLKVNPYEAKIIRKMFDLYLNQGFGFLKIANFLNKEGIKTKRDCKWHPYSVGKVLSNQLYMGKVINGKSYVKDFLTGERGVNREADFFIANKPDLMIVDEYTFKKAQKIMKKRNEDFRHKKERQSNKYCFSTLIQCESCGYSFRRMYRKYTKEYIRWVCTGRNSQGKDFCNNSTTIDEAELLTAIQDYFSEMIDSQKNLMGKVIHLLKRKWSKEDFTCNTNKIQKEIIRLKRIKRKQTEMYEFEIISIEELKERVGEINKQIESYEKELKSFKQEENIHMQIDMLVQRYCVNINEILCGGEFGNMLLKNLIEKILVSEQGNIKVRLNLFSEVDIMNICSG